jgi:hypothetical protein
MHPLLARANLSTPGETSAGVTSLGFFVFLPIPVFIEKLLHQDRFRATIPSSLDPQHPGFVFL